MSISLITEAYNLGEGQSKASLAEALKTLSAIRTRYTDLDIMIVDPLADPSIEAFAVNIDPFFKYVAVPGSSYEGQKDVAVQRSTSDFVVFLDGDCHPAHDTWLDELMAPFQDREISAVGGLTVYDDFSLTGQAMSVMDFGFLFVENGEPLGCYASNNVAFRREAWITCPIPYHESLRSVCYAHAQVMARMGYRLVLSRNALVLHELPDPQKERTRRGYDLVSACWADPRLATTKLIVEAGAAARILAEQSALEELRLHCAPECLGITEKNLPLVLEEIKRLRAFDLVGLVGRP